MSQTKKPFLSFHDSRSVNAGKRILMPPQLCLAPTQPDRVQFPKTRYDCFGPIPLQSPMVGSSPAVISSPNLERPIFPSRSSSATDYFSYTDTARNSMDTFTNSDATLYGNGSTDRLTSRDSLLLPLLSKPTFPSRLRSCVQAITQAFYNHVDPKTIFEMLDFREVVYPYDPWKYTVLALVGMAVAAIIVSQHYTHWIDKSMAITRQNLLPVLILVLGLEPLMSIVILILARIPDPPSTDQVSEKEGTVDWNQTMQDLTKANVNSKMEVSEKSTEDIESQTEGLEKANEYRTALVIPCHNSDERAVKITLESASKHFRPQDIFVVDNGRSKYPPNNFRQFIRDQHPDIVYIWSPIGSKNAAQLVGAIAAKSYDYIMTVDDDVSIPANFSPPIHKINHLTKGVAYPLNAIDANGHCPLFMVGWQDCEYKMAGVSKLAESAVCGVLYPHGAGWFCERDTLIDLMSNYHSLDFIADDVNSGIALQKMKKRIAFDPNVILKTEVPTTIFGPGLNWWQQRKNSWEMGRHGRLLAFAGRLFLSLNGQTTPHGIIAQKTIHAYAICTIVVDWIRIPVFITMGSNVYFWRQALLLTLISVIPLLLLKYISARKRKDLQPGFWASVTYPFYKQLYALVSIMGAVRSVTWYIGGHKKPKTIKQMLEDGDERLFWLDERFESNPGWCADEGEALGLVPGAGTMRSGCVDGIEFGATNASGGGGDGGGSHGGS